MRGNPISYADPDGDIVWFVPVIAGVIGAGINVARQWDQIDNGWDFAAAAAIGAGAGVAGVFAAPAAGVGATLGATVASYAGAGAIGGAVAGSINGFGNGVYFTDGNAAQRVGAGIKGGVIEGAIGAGTGAVIGAGFGVGAHWLSPRVPVAPSGLETGVGNASGTAGSGARAGAPGVEIGDLTLAAGQGGLDVAEASAQWGVGISSVGRQNIGESVNALLRGPAGQLIGSQAGKNAAIRTVSPRQANTLISNLRSMGASPIAKPGYPGQWYNFPNGSGFGVRSVQSAASTRLGTSGTIDLSGIPGAAARKIKF